MDDEVAGLISERLKAYRARAGLSLKRPVAFEVPVATFLTSESDVRVHVTRRGSGQELRSADGKYISRALFPFEGERRTELYELRLEPGCIHASSAHAGGTTENLVVVQGALTLEVAGARTELNAGDAAFFAADVPHAYRNDSTVPAVAHLVMSYSQSVNY